MGLLKPAGKQNFREHLRPNSRSFFKRTQSREGRRICGAGVGIGLLAALAVTQLLSSLLVGVSSLHPSENLAAIWEFGQSITNEFKRSHLLDHLVRHSAQRLEFDLAERIARSIPTPYWRFTAMNAVAAELLRRDREFGSIGARNSVHERLLQEIEQGPSIRP